MAIYDTIDALKIWIEDTFGARCEDYDAGCMGCRAWQAYDELDLLSEM